MNHIAKDRAGCWQYFLVKYNYRSDSKIECLLKCFMFDGFFPQTSHDFLYNKRLLGFFLLIPVTRGSKLLQTVGSHLVAQLQSPLRPISSPQLYQGNPFQHSLHI